jgi:PST family polysaccharide transporter
MKTVRLSLLFLGALGLIFGLAIFFAAPLLVHLVLGQAFQNSVPVLRVFALWIPLVALSTVIIFQLLLPNQLDKQFNIVNFTAGLIGIGAAFLLAPRFSAVGIAWSAVIVQTYTLLAFSVVLQRAGLNPFAPAAPAASPRFTGHVPILAPARGGQQMKIRLREKLANAEVRSPQPAVIAIPRPTPQQAMGRNEPRDRG